MQKNKTFEQFKLWSFLYVEHPDNKPHDCTFKTPQKQDKCNTLFLINGWLCLAFCAIVAFTHKAWQQPTIAALHT